MTTEEELHDHLERLHQRTGEATGYWPHRFLSSVRSKGGLAVAKQLLAPGQVSSGFVRLTEEHRADLSVEYIVLSDKYASFFTTVELDEARQRLATLPKSAFPTTLSDRVSSGDEVPPGT